MKRSDKFRSPRYVLAHAIAIPALCSGLLASGISQAAQLNLADEPLFLQQSVDPNVFFMLDDSGSMDWEVLTQPHWNACAYDAANPFSSDSDCRSQITTTMWQYGTSTNSSLDRTSYSYGYLYDTNDNVWGTCSGSYRRYDCAGYTKDWRIKSSSFNLIYYDPGLEYEPWSGTGMSDADFFAARSNPQGYVASVSAVNETLIQDAVPQQSARTAMSGYSDTTDLTGFVYNVWHDTHGYSTAASYPQAGASYRKQIGVDTDAREGDVDMWDDYTRYTVYANKIKVEYIEASIDINGNYSAVVTSDSEITNAATVAAIQKNVANWFQYYRRRMLVAKAGIAKVVADPNSSDFRFGMSVLNNYSRWFSPLPPKDVTRYTEYNKSLLNDMFSTQKPNSSTPLQRGLELAGEYYRNNLLGKLYTVPSNLSQVISENPITEACQASYSVLFTDGYWNQSYSGPATRDSDKDGYSSTVADVAHWYYTNDLQPGLADKVPVPGSNGQFTFQRMKTYTVSLGLYGALPTDGAGAWPQADADGNTLIDFTYPNLVDMDWGDPSVADDPAKIDDMWHAAYNTEAAFIQANNSQELVDGLQSALSDIDKEVSSSASVATSSGSTSDPDAGIFKAEFESGSWTGDLIRYGFEADNSLSTTPSWAASTVLTSQVNGNGYDTSRQVITYNPTSGMGVAFRWPSDYQSTSTTTLSDAQVSALLSDSPYAANTADANETTWNQDYGQRIVNYIRGQQAYEKGKTVSCSYVDPVSGSTTNICKLRKRETDSSKTPNVLGDIIDSSPLYVSNPNLSIPDSLGDGTAGEPDAGNESDYSNFVSSNKNRNPIVYVGSNDGMLHAFDAETGEEKLAYIPSVAVENLHELADSDYGHRYFVNGPLTAGDAYFGTAWHTVLVGTMGAGGQLVYALDITDPSATSFQEARADNRILWEFSDDDDADLGYVYGRATIARLANGKWAAIFGNGYNNSEADGAASSNGHAALFIVDIEDGSLIKKIILAENTGILTPSSPNGAATPAVVDYNSDGVADIVYVGDLEGHLWKINISSTNSTNWNVAGASAAATSKVPFFETATGQPITTKPEIGFGPQGIGNMILFGTGKYLESNDTQTSGVPTQAFYGVWDQVKMSDSDLSTLSLSDFPLTQSDLLEQKITADKQAVGATSWIARQLSTTEVDYKTQKGWFIEFEYAGVNNGEKHVVQPLLRGDLLLFVTWLPQSDACSGGGTSWIWIVNPIHGTPFNQPPLDLDGNGVRNMADSSLGMGGGANTDGAWQCGVNCLTDGLITTPALVSNKGNTGAGGQDCEDQAIATNSKGSIGAAAELSCAPWQGRQSWRQLK